MSIVQTADAPDKTRRPVVPIRPKFASPEHYVADVYQAIDDRREPWRPANRDEALAILDADPDLARERKLVLVDDLRWWGIPLWGLRPIEPFGDGWKERFIETLANDAEFAAAVAHYTKGAAGGE